nr:MAG TPA: hypothetical protein [Bacteriophage sp.]
MKGNDDGFYFRYGYDCCRVRCCSCLHPEYIERSKE